MNRASTPTFVLERRLYTKPHMEEKIDHVMDVANRMYNRGVKHYRSVIAELEQDLWFQKMMPLYLEYRNEHMDEKNPYSGDIEACLAGYGLTEYDMHEWFGVQKVRSLNGSIGINIVQKLASSLYQAVRKVIFGNGKTLHYRKHGTTCSLSEKSAKSGIIYHNSTKKGEYISFMGTEIPLKPIRSKDFYAQEAMTNRIKYCMLVRKPFKSGYRYFVQLVLEGYPPRKYVAPEDGKTAIDPGVSTHTWYGDHTCGYTELVPDIAKYNDAIQKAAVKYERRRRMANPENFNSDGTIRKDTADFLKVWNRTKGMLHALDELKDAYRKRTAYVKNSHGYTTNRIAAKTKVAYSEKMNYKALVKRSKNTERQNKASQVTKNGKTKTVYKYKRKKRFGNSVLCHSPALFLQMLKRKIERSGGYWFEIEPKQLKASQYDHCDNDFKKAGLNDRTKQVGGKLVQRDFYSSFLMHCSPDGVIHDRDICIREFTRFLKKQGMIVARILKTGDHTGNFGLKDFLKKKPAVS